MPRVENVSRDALDRRLRSGAWWTTPSQQTEPVLRLALTRDEAAKALGISLRSVDALIAEQASGFPVVRVGRKVLVPVQLLERWLEEQYERDKQGGGG